MLAFVSGANETTHLDAKPLKRSHGTLCDRDALLVSNERISELAGLDVGFPGPLGLAPSHQRHRCAIGLYESDGA